MLLTDKNLLEKYRIEQRLWQGIPSIEVTRGGRIFLTYYSGGTKEEIGNYCILSKSDNGEYFEDIARIPRGSDNEAEVAQYLDLDKVIRTIPTGFDATALIGKIFIVTGTGKYFKNVEWIPSTTSES